MTRARRSRIEEQQLVCAEKATEIITQPVIVDYCELKVSLISILLILKWDIFLLHVQLQIKSVVNQCQLKQIMGRIYSL